MLKLLNLVSGIPAPSSPNPTTQNILAEDYLSWGQELESQRQFQAASSVYQHLASHSRHGGIQAQARQRLAVLQGQGNLGDHFEFLSGQFLDQLTDPGLFLGMLAAGWAFRGVSLGAGRILGRQNLSARALAWGLGFGAEVPAFALTVRGIHEVQGQAQDWSRQALREDLLRTGLTLLFLKSSAALGQLSVNGLFRGAPTPSSFTRFSTQVIPQAAIYTGLLGSHATEQYLGLNLPSRHPFLDSLVTLLHFKMAGNLLHTYLPQGPLRPGSLLRLSPSHPSLITPEGVRVNPQIYIMSKSEGGGGRFRSFKPAETKVDSSLIPRNFNSRNFLALRNQFSQVEFGFGLAFLELKGAPLW
ncbi:MAG: hypothetical protein R3257_06715, partial [bacterium]|nr:hypothetical protein [bacterium]